MTDLGGCFGLSKLVQAVVELLQRHAARRSLRDHARAVGLDHPAMVRPLAVVEEEHLIVRNARCLAQRWKVRPALVRGEWRRPPNLQMPLVLPALHQERIEGDARDDLEHLPAGEPSH
eukprot:4488029-Pleurochrysis_carterae.AAC.4